MNTAHTMRHSRIVLLGTLGLLLAAAFPLHAQDKAEDIRKYVDQARELAKDKKYSEAIDAVKRAIRLAPRNDQLLALASEYELRAGQYQEGLEHALQAEKINNKVGSYLVLVAAHSVGTQEFERTREYCQRILKGGTEAYGAQACKDARTVLALLLPKTYTIHWDLDPRKGQLYNGEYPIALPRTGLPYQTVTYEIKGVQRSRLIKGTVNDVLYVRPQGKTPFSLTTRVTVKPYSYKQEIAKAKSAAKTLSQEARSYLGASEGINPRSPALVKLATELKGGDTVETARNILVWMRKNIKYKFESSSITELDFKKVDEIIDRGHAECRGYAMLFTALCRAAGVPARPIWGLATVSGDQDRRFGNITSHNFAEFYVPGCGWVPVDPQDPQTLGFLPTRCIHIFMDARKGPNSLELLPKLNLAVMNGGKVKFEESSGESAP